ncbi:hypothetical protein V500_07337 [Pseudogymnoascus sp. VKM F-4518 (FW-2643)]|nr:hypothetical protein V500_07337 [Pseudogymnoascus sp. VKM F-4518 (FW-2643)]
MSELQRAFAKAKLAGLPPVVPEPLVDLDEEEEERDIFPELPTERSDDDSSSASSASSASSTGTIRPTSTNSNLKVTHQVYLTSPLSSPTKPGPLFVTHHGAGSSGLTFALLAKSIRALLPNAGILSLDARGHGSTTVETLNERDPMGGILDVSLETLTDDLITVIQKTKEAMNWPTMPPIILIGHSLGGSVVTSVAARGTLGSSLLCYAVLDIVERTAIESLASMAGYLKGRPATFPSLEAGIAWHVRTGSLKNVESARVSVPPLLTLLYNKPKDDTTSTAARQIFNWRADLASTEPFWTGCGNREVRQGDDDWTDAGQVCPADFPGCGTLSARRPAGEDGSEYRGLLQAERPQRAGVATKGVGYVAAGEEGIDVDRTTYEITKPDDTTRSWIRLVHGYRCI